MLRRKANLDEMIVFKNELTWNIEDLLDQAIRTKMGQRRVSQGCGAEHAEEIVSQIVQEDQDLLGMPKPFATMSE